jgi:hypothetical protein
MPGGPGCASRRRQVGSAREERAMYETPEDLIALNALLERSHARAGNHLRSIFTPERRIPAAELVTLLPGVQVLNWRPSAVPARLASPRSTAFVIGGDSGSAPPRPRSASPICASDLRSARVTRGVRSSRSSSTARPRSSIGAIWPMPGSPPTTARSTASAGRSGTSPSNSPASTRPTSTPIGPVATTVPPEASDGR